MLSFFSAKMFRQNVYNLKFLFPLSKVVIINVMFKIVYTTKINLGTYLKLLVNNLFYKHLIRTSS